MGPDDPQGTSRGSRRLRTDTRRDGTGPRKQDRPCIAERAPDGHRHALGDDVGSVRTSQSRGRSGQRGYPSATPRSRRLDRAGRGRAARGPCRDGSRRSHIAIRSGALRRGIAVRIAGQRRPRPRPHGGTPPRGSLPLAADLGHHGQPEGGAADPGQHRRVRRQPHEVHATRRDGPMPVPGTALHFHAHQAQPPGTLVRWGFGDLYARVPGGVVRRMAAAVRTDLFCSDADHSRIDHRSLRARRMSKESEPAIRQRRQQRPAPGRAVLSRSVAWRTGRSVLRHDRDGDDRPESAATWAASPELGRTAARRYGHFGW